MNIYRLLAKTNRPRFKAARKLLQAQQRKLSRELIEATPEQLDEVASRGNHGRRPVTSWKSRDYLCLLYLDKIEGTDEEFLRLSINRCELQNDGNWKGDITWNELMKIKSAVGFENHWAVEIYPPDDEVVNVANIRHLFVTRKPVFAWSRPEQTPAPAIMLDALDEEPEAEELGPTDLAAERADRARDEEETLPDYDQSQCLCFQNPPCTHCINPDSH